MRCKHCGIRLDPEYVAYEADECPYCGEPTTVEMKIQARIEMKEGEDVEMDDPNDDRETMMPGDYGYLA